MTSKLKNKKILISAGGTGGHVYPALAVANALHQLGAEIHWIGTQKGIESKLVTPPFQLHQIKVEGIRGKGVLKLIKAPFVISKAILESRQVIKKIQPDVYIGFGGFVTGPGGIAAKLTHTPIIIHEQNAAMGLTNRILKHIAQKVLLAFPIKDLDIKAIGNPIRPEISAILEKTEINHPTHLLIIGGSQGAKAINDVIPQAAKQLDKQVTITHQTGEYSYQSTLDQYQQLNINANVVRYIDDMKTAYQEADLIIARAGALSVSEICSAGRAAIFIPLPHAVDNHQFLNAQFSQDYQAAVILEQKKLTPDSLSQLINELNSPEKLKEMAKQAKQLSHCNALDQITQQVIEVIYE